jgi:biopolymer transport protein ExbD
MPEPEPAEGASSPDGQPPIKLVLRADDRGNLVGIHLNHKDLTPGGFSAVRKSIIDMLGDARGANAAPASAEIEIASDYNLRYEYVIDAITAVAGYQDENGRMVKLVEKIKFAPPRKRPLAQSVKANRDDPAKPPKSELTKPPPQDTIIIQLTKAGFVDVQGTVLPIQELPQRLAREREKLDSTKKAPSDVTIVIRATHDCPTSKVQEVIKICQDHEFVRFALRAKKKEPDTPANRAEDRSAEQGRVVNVTTVFRGATPREIESSVTLPLERWLLGLQGVRAVTSTSREGVSVVRLELTPDHDLDRAKRTVAEAIDGVAAVLPRGAEPPAVTTIARDTFPGIWLALVAEEQASAGLFPVAQRIRDRLARIPDVSEVRIFGGRLRELQVRCDPRKLVGHGLSLDNCLRAIKRETEAKPPKADDLRDVVLGRQDIATIRVRDVAEVRDAAAPPDSLAWLDGQPAVAIGVFFPVSVAGESLARIRRELSDIESTLPENVSFSPAAGADPTSPGVLLVELLGPAQADVETLRKLADHLERQVRPLSVNGVLSVWRGDAPNAVRLLFHAKAGTADEAALLETLRQHCKELPGVFSRVAQITPGSVVGRAPHDVDLALMGPDRDQLGKWSTAVARRLGRAGYADVVYEAPVVTPEISMKLRRDRLTQLGLDLPSISQAMLASEHGVLLSGRGNDRTAIRVFLGNKIDEGKPGALEVPVGNTLVPLTELADVEVVAGVDRLQRRNLRPMVRVTAALPAGGDATQCDSAVRMAEEIRRELQLSDDYCVERQ